MKILILEDDIRIRKKLENQMAETFETAKIDSFRLLSDAEDKLNTTIYDIISLDVNLPDGNGLDLAKRIRENSLNKHTYLLIITGESTMEVAFRAYDQTKCFKFLSKPFEISELETTLMELKELILSKPMYDYFYYQSRHLMIKLPVLEIVSFEINQRTCYIKTLADEYTLIRYTLKDVLANTSCDQFIQVHRSIVVNKDYIKSVKFEDKTWNCYLVNSRVVAVGKKFLNNLKSYMES